MAHFVRLVNNTWVSRDLIGYARQSAGFRGPWYLADKEGTPLGEADIEHFDPEDADKIIVPAAPGEIAMLVTANIDAKGDVDPDPIVVEYQIAAWEIDTSMIGARSVTANPVFIKITSPSEMIFIKMPDGAWISQEDTRHMTKEDAIAEGYQRAIDNDKRRRHMEASAKLDKKPATG